MGWTRRTFLGQVGLTLTALGVGEAGWLTQCDRSSSALAAPSHRTLALLIGINQYPEEVSDYAPSRGSALNGCLTDVELQRELLLHRFNLAPANILTLTDHQATRAGIEAAFQAHLTDQVRSGDGVIIHFSGLGSRVRMGQTGEGDRLALVPIDGRLPTVEDPVLRDWPEETLALLLRTLPTEHITTILDCSWGDSGQLLPAGWRIRTRPSTPSGPLIQDEVSVQTTLRSRLKGGPETDRPTWPGIVLTAAPLEQAALEGPWHGFQAGLFTYSLTRALWETFPATTLWFCLGQTSEAIARFTSTEQHPQVTGKKAQEANLIPYFTPVAPGGSVGVVKAMDEDGRGVQLWLGGLSPYLLEYLGTGSVLVLVSSTSAEPSALVQVRSRSGLVAQARLLSEGATPTLGQPVRERVRVLPRSVGLTIALDSGLERIERVDATSAFAALSRNITIASGEQVADYWFGRYQPPSLPLAAVFSTDVSVAPADPTADLKGNSIPSQRGYALLNSARVPLPGTLVLGEAAVKTVVNRLAPNLQALLALKWLRLTENRDSSEVGVRVGLEPAGEPGPALLVQETRLAASLGLPPASAGKGAIALRHPIPLMDGTAIHYRIQNTSAQPLYVTLLGLNGEGTAIALYPCSELSDNCLPPQSTVLIPLTASAPNWSTVDHPALAETYVITSTVPLTQTYTLLGRVGHSTSGSFRIGAIANALEVAQSIVQDLHQGVGALAPLPDSPPDTYILPMETWASLSFTYAVATTRSPATRNVIDNALSRIHSG